MAAAAVGSLAARLGEVASFKLVRAGRRKTQKPFWIHPNQPLKQERLPDESVISSSASHLVPVQRQTVTGRAHTHTRH